MPDSETKEKFRAKGVTAPCIYENIDEYKMENTERNWEHLRSLGN